MPIIKSAIKKLRQDRKREKHNREIKKTLKKAISLAKIKRTNETVQKAISLVNKAVKTHIFHKNKAARITSTLAKLIKEKATQKKVKKEVEKKPSTS